MECSTVTQMFLRLDELSRVKKDLIDSNAQHTHALSIIEEKDKALRQHGEDMNELQNKLKVCFSFFINNIMDVFSTSSISTSSYAGVTSEHCKIKSDC